MQEVSVKQVSPVAAEISIIVGKNEVEAEFNKFADEIKTKVKLDGFRPGTAPLNVIRQRFAKEIKAEVSSRLVHRETEAAIKEKNLKAVGNPSLKEDYRATKQRQWLGDFKLDGTFVFEVSTDLEPEIEITNYKGFEIELDIPNPDAWVEGRLKEIQMQYSEKEPVVREAREGDEVTVFFTATDETGPINDEFGGWRTFVLGSANIFVAGQATGKIFDEQVIGKTPGSRFSFTVECFAEDSPDRVAKKIVIDGTLQTAIELKVCPLNDELAQKAFYDNFEHMMSELRAKAKEEFEKPRKAKMIDAIMTRILEEHPFLVPPSWIENEMRVIALRFGLKEMPSDPEQLNGLREIAHRSVQQSFVLDKIYQKEESLKFTGEEIEAVLATEAAKVGKTGAELLAHLKNSGRYEGFVSYMEQQKTVDFLIANSNIKQKAA